PRAATRRTTTEDGGPSFRGPGSHNANAHANSSLHPYARVSDAIYLPVCSRCSRRLLPKFCRLCTPQNTKAQDDRVEVVRRGGNISSREETLSKKRRPWNRWARMDAKKGVPNDAEE